MHPKDAAKGVDVLRSHKARQDQLRQAAGTNGHDNDLVFASQAGTPADASHVRRSFRRVVEAAGLDSRTWTPRELRHSFVSLLSDAGVPIEQISRLVGHSGTTATETIYRKQIRPAITDGADIVDRIFPRQGEPGCLVTQHRRYAGPVEITCLLSWSGWPDLNRRPLRPEPRKRSNNQPDDGRMLRSEHCARTS